MPDPCPLASEEDPNEARPSILLFSYLLLPALLWLAIIAVITIALRNFRGCAAANLELAPIALVAARNAQGKSSIAQAVGAVLTGQVTPLGVTKTSAAQLVKSGAEAGFAAVQGESGTARIDWPACQTRTRGEPPTASAYAAGLESVATLAAKERARVFGNYLHADPDRTDLAAAVADLGGEAAVTAVWKSIETHGWDGAHQVQRDRGVELKARWRQITATTYGSRVGASWRPDLDDDDGELSENDLLAAVVKAKAERDRAIAAAAVSGAERDRLEAELASLEGRKDLLLQAEADAERIAAELDAAREARAALPPGTVDAGMPCPHCGAFVIVRRVDLATTRLEAAKVDAPLPAELKKRRLAIAAADGAIARLMGQSTDADHAVERARLAMQSAAEARFHLDRLPPAGNAGIDVDAAKAEADRAEKRLADSRAKREAGDLHRRIQNNEGLISLLAPDGLRAAKLDQVLDIFNGSLGELSEAAGWHAVGVEADLTPTYQGRVYALCSTSEQYRIRAVLAVAMARLDGSAMAVLDAADVLDGPTRSGLFALLDEAGLPALVTMTATRASQVPDLAANGLGHSYWLNDGVCEPLLSGQEVAA